MKLKLVENWRAGFRWFSVWAFALIAFFAQNPLPPEVVAILPKPLADNLITLVAACGMILRFVQQNPTDKYRHDSKQPNNKSQDEDHWSK